MKIQYIYSNDSYNISIIKNKYLVKTCSNLQKYKG